MILPPPAGTGEAAVRAALVAGTLAAAAPGLARACAGRGWLWLAVLLPWVTPSVLVGYAYVGLAQSWDAAAATQVLYGALLLCRFLPVAVGLAVVLPAPPLDATGRFLADQVGKYGLRARLHGPLRNQLALFATVFVLAFQEFEWASLLPDVRSWTVTVFDAQAGGVELGPTLAMAGVPLALELAALGGAVAILHATAREGAVDDGARVAELPLTGGRRSLAVTATLVAASLGTAIPLAVVLPSWTELPAQLPFAADLGHGCLLAGGATAIAVAFGWLCPLPLLLLLALPGLCGGLVYGLVVRAVFQWPVLAWSAETPLPVLVGMAGLALPVCVLLRLAGRQLAPSAAVYASELLGQSGRSGQRRAAGALWARMRGTPRAVVVVLLFAFCLFEVVVAELLAPTNMTPAAPRLYNLLHYGRSPGLAAMLLAMIGTGLAASVVAFLLLRRRWLWRR